MKKQLCEAILVLLFATVACATLAGCSDVRATVDTNATSTGIGNSTNATGTNVTDTDTSANGTNSTVSGDYIEKYTLVRMEMVTGEVLDKDDLDVLYKDTGGAAHSYVGIKDDKNLTLLLGTNITECTYVENGNIIAASDAYGTKVDFVKTDNGIKVEFSDEMMGTQGEGFTAYFEKSV